MSEDGIYRAPLEVVVDAGVVEVLGRPAGPAGVSVLTLDDGTEVEVDHAAPGTLVRLLVGTEPAALAVLLGEARAAEVAYQADLARSRSGRVDGDPRRVPLPGADELPGSPPAPQVRSGPWLGARERVAVAAVAAEVAHDDTRHPLVRVVAAADAMVAAADLALPLDGLLDRLAALVVDLVDEVPDEDLRRVPEEDPKRPVQLTSVLLRAGAVRRSCRAPLADLLSRIREAGRLDGLAETARWTAMRLQPLEGVSHSLERLPESRFPTAAPSEVRPPPEVPGEWSELEQVGEGRYVFRTGRSHTGRWVRVLDRDGLVLLAAAPLHEDRLLLAAELVVPDDLDRADLLVEVVDPRDLEAARGPLETLRAAVAVGRAAAALARAEMPDESRSAWRECASLWDEVGDESRAGLAGGYAGGLLRPVAAGVGLMFCDELTGEFDDGVDDVADGTTSRRR